MKYDLNKKQTIATKRTLSTLVNTMFTLLKTKSFEAITVQELCSLSLIPRATFYNYFEDKFDLLNYCWFTLKEHLDPGSHDSSNCLNLLKVFLSKSVDYFDSNIESINLILKHNDISHYLVSSYRLYLTNTILSQINSYISSLLVPNKIAAKHCADTVITLLEWKYVNKNNCSSDELIGYLETLLNNIYA